MDFTFLCRYNCGYNCAVLSFVLTTMNSTATTTTKKCTHEHAHSINNINGNKTIYNKSNRSDLSLLILYTILIYEYWLFLYCLCLQSCIQFTILFCFVVGQCIEQVSYWSWLECDNYQYTTNSTIINALSTHVIKLKPFQTVQQIIWRWAFFFFFFFVFRF